MELSIAREAQQVRGAERRPAEEEALQDPEVAARNQIDVNPGQQTAEPTPGPRRDRELSNSTAASSMRWPVYSPAA